MKSYRELIEQTFEFPQKEFKVRDHELLFNDVPLMEIIAEVLQVGVSSKKVLEMYLELLSKVGSEYHVLVEAELRRIREEGGIYCVQARKTA